MDTKWLAALPKWLFVALFLSAVLFLVFSSATGRKLTWSPFGIDHPLHTTIETLESENQEKDAKLAELLKSNTEARLNDDIIYAEVKKTKPKDLLGRKLRGMVSLGEGPFAENVFELRIFFEQPDSKVLLASNPELVAACNNEKSPIFESEIAIKPAWFHTDVPGAAENPNQLLGLESMLEHLDECDGVPDLIDSRYHIWVYRQFFANSFSLELGNFEYIDTTAEVMVNQKTRVWIP